MIAISSTELRRNLRKYLDKAQHERVIIRYRNAETYEIVPTGKLSDFANTDITQRLKHSLEQVKEGKTQVLKKSEINAFLGLE